MKYHNSKILRLAAIGFMLCPGLYALDSNGNGLSDVWEELFNAGGVSLEDDDDGDGFTSFEECVAGTDPFDSKDRPQIVPLVVQNNPDIQKLSFKTLLGKYYTVKKSDDLTGFRDLSPGWDGDGHLRTVLIDNSLGIGETLSTVKADFWADVSTSSISGLTALSSFPGTPDGMLALTQPEAPDFKATGYGARIYALIKAPETGNYLFYLSSNGPAQLYFDTLPDGRNASKVAEISAEQVGLKPGEWATFPTQRSTHFRLVAGQSYYVELRYVSNASPFHAQMAWEGPGLTGIEKIDRDDLADIKFVVGGLNAGDLFRRDYDTLGQTALLFPWGAIAPAPVGMSGNVERLDKFTEHVTIPFSATSTEHLYATWLFNMGSTHVETSLVFRNGGNQQEGPLINLETEDDGTGSLIPFLRAGGPSGADVSHPIKFDQTYRVEVVSTLSTAGLQYSTQAGSRTVDEDRFDIYVTDSSGKLIGSSTGLTFRDGGGVLNAFKDIKIIRGNGLDIFFDDWVFTNGRISGDGHLLANDDSQGDFFSLSIRETDQDDDRIADWEEVALAPYKELLFFDDETTNGLSDTNVVKDAIDANKGAILVSLVASDAAAFENNYPNTVPDHGEITLTRSGSLAPVTVDLCVAPLKATGNTATVCNGACCILVGSAGDEEAELADYQLIDENGKVITDSVTFAFGENKKVLTLEAIDDAINEYPETVNIALASASDGRYTISSTNGASIQIFDLPENPDNLTIFKGEFSPEGGVATSASGTISATINGPRTEVRIWNSFSGLTSMQSTSHVHKAGAGRQSGPIIYPITVTPGDAGGAPLLGQLEHFTGNPADLVNGNTIASSANSKKGPGYVWDLKNSSGAIPTAGGAASKQAIIDSLFEQNGETRLYLNIHTANYSMGEIWAFFEVAEGSIEDPGDAAAADVPGTAGYPQLAGDQLESEVRRFLNQATFGAEDDEVSALIAVIERERLSDPDYHRHQAFSDWIDNQMNASTTPQTYLLDYFAASYFQYLKITGVYDSSRNPSDGTTLTPALPSTWPTIDRSDPNPEYWYMDKVFPVTRSQWIMADRQKLLGSTSTTAFNRLNSQAFEQLMLNGGDQLRHKMGYALQQIVVASKSHLSIRFNPFASVNYQDQINIRAFEHYRDVLGYVNWSPIMGVWLSSLKNQKAIDFDGDGFYDSFPDENLARENMQLFSIGLFDQWPDGTLRLTPEGLPSPTYTNHDIREFAKVLTGQSFSLKRENPNQGGQRTWGGQPYAPDSNDFFARSDFSVHSRVYLYPMKMFEGYHSSGSKTFAGTTIDNSHISDLNSRAVADVESAIDWLAGTPGDGKPDFDMVNSHVSTPAFISHRLIQRFTTSNPSREYLHRVATVFKNSEGHLGLTLKAILLDPAARHIDFSNLQGHTRFGLKKSPLEAYFQLMRTLGAHTDVQLKKPVGAAAGTPAKPDLYLENFQYPLAQLNGQKRNVRFLGAHRHDLHMGVFYQPTVFNFYSPDFSPTGPISAEGLVAPELQLADTVSVIENINYSRAIIVSEGGISGYPLGASTTNQNDLLQLSADSKSDHERLPRQALADAFYPSVAPTVPAGSTRTSESLADEAMLDELDKRLTCGLFKLRYPYDPSDDGVADSQGFRPLKNPREIIIDAMTDAYKDPYNGSKDEQDRLGKFSEALYLLTLSPEYQIKK